MSYGLLCFLLHALEMLNYTAFRLFWHAKISMNWTLLAVVTLHGKLLNRLKVGGMQRQL